VNQGRVYVPFSLSMRQLKHVSVSVCQRLQGRHM
jgi:hypothetical protein